jgi:hypothetical protein
MEEGPGDLSKEDPAQGCKRKHRYDPVGVDGSQGSIRRKHRYDPVGVDGSQGSIRRGKGGSRVFNDAGNSKGAIKNRQEHLLRRTTTGNRDKQLGFASDARRCPGEHDS